MKRTEVHHQVQTDDLQIHVPAKQLGRRMHASYVRPDIILFFCDICIFTEASGYLVPSLIRFDQNRILWDLLGGKNVLPLILPMTKFDHMFFMAAFSTG